MAGSSPQSPPPSNNPQEPTSFPGGAPPSIGTSAAAPGRSRVLLLAVVVIVVVAIVAVAGLWAAGIGPFAKTSSAGEETFSQAAGSAQSAANGESGGPWSVVGGFGFQWGSSSLQGTSGLGSLTGSSGCSTTMLTSATAISLPSSTVAVSSGTSSAWLIWLAGSGDDMFVTVLGGSATPIAKIGGASCPLTSLGATLSLPSGYVDSPAAGAAAYAHGGSAFLANHSKVDVGYTLTPAISFSIAGHTSVQPARWSVTMTNCDLSGNSGTTMDQKPPIMFTDTVNASSGAAANGTTSITSCPAGNPNSASQVPSFGYVSLGEWSSGSSYNFFVNTSVQGAPGNGITWGDLSVSVETSNGDPVTSGSIEADVVGITGCIVATYPFTTGQWSSPSSGACTGTTGGSASITAGQTLSVKLANNPSGLGEWIVVTAHGSFSGTTFVQIP